MTPTLFTVFPLPESEGFSELWLLGTNHMIETGSLTAILNKPYTVYLGVSNHMNELKYYTVSVKLRNHSQALEEQASEFPSQLESVYEYPLFLMNNKTWEEPFVFSFKTVSFEQNMSRISMLSINDKDVRVDKILTRDEVGGRFRCQLLFELWIYNVKISDFQYHNRSVWFWVNLVESS